MPKKAMNIQHYRKNQSVCVKCAENDVKINKRSWFVDIFLHDENI